MIVTRLQFFCDRDHGIPIHFPAVDGAIFTPAEVRRRAKNQGWRRRKGYDLCPDCAKSESGGIDG